MLIKWRVRTLVIVLFFSGVKMLAQETWIARSSGVSANLWGVAYGGGQWVVVGEQGAILSSPDGITWTKRNSGFPDRWLTGITYANHLWVAVGGTAPTAESFGLILTSPDAITWTPRLASGTRLNNVAYGNGTFLAVDDVGGSWISSDGLSWSHRFAGRGGYLRALGFGAPIFVTGGLDGLQPTFDGVDYPSWRAATEATTRLQPAKIEGVAYGRGQFMAVTATGGPVYTSPDGLHWTLLPVSLDLAARGAVFFNNQFVVVGTAGAAGGGIVTSFDGSGWTDRATGLVAGEVLLGVSAGPEFVVAVGQKGVLLQSPASAVAPFIVVQPKTRFAFGSVAFTVTAGGSLPLRYQWRRNSLPIEGATTDLLFLPSVQAGDAADYSCTVTNSAGTALSSAATLIASTPEHSRQATDATFSLGPALSSPPRVAVAQPDGKMVLGGNFSLVDQGRTQFGVARLNPDGSLDATFKPAAIDSAGAVAAIALQSDGKLLIGGSFKTVDGVGRSNLVRFTPAGSLDAAFVPPATLLDVSQVAPGFDGRIYVSSQGILLRLLPDGAADPSFPGGVAQRRFALQPDGKIVIVTAGEPDTGWLNRLNPDGTPDPTFVRVKLNLAASAVVALRILSDGRIMVATATNIFRFQPTGEFDPTFRQFRDYDFRAGGVDFTSDGRTWLAGVDRWEGIFVTARVLRLDANGYFDTTFYPNAAPPRGSLTAILALDDGRALLAGGFSYSSTGPLTQLARLNALVLSSVIQPVLAGVDSRYYEVPPGEPLTLPVRSTGGILAAYAYTSSGSAPQVGTGSSQPMEIPARSVATGAYFVQASDFYGAETTQFFFVRVVAPPSVPRITQQPSSLQTNSGRPVALTVFGEGSEALSYQWFRNGTALPGATRQDYAVGRSSVSDSGDYLVTIRSSLGTISSKTVHVGIDETPRLVNLSTRGAVGQGDGTLIVGFVSAGPGNKRLLLRAVGPALGRAPFNLTGTLADPIMRVYSATRGLIYTNDDWGQANDVPGIATADTRLGAFPLATGSGDSAGLLDLVPGAYTVVISGQGATPTGLALVEVYEDDASSGRLINLSSRGFVTPGTSVMIPAFVTSPTGAPRKFLVRGVGPGLTAFGVNNTLANPLLTVVDGNGRTVASNDDWEQNQDVAGLRSITAQLTFPLAAGSKDSALLLSLAPGQYSCVVSGVGNLSGSALVEIYEVP